jgi:hypothetical protein
MQFFHSHYYLQQIFFSQLKSLFLIMLSYTQITHFHSLFANKFIDAIGVFFIHTLRDTDSPILCENQDRLEPGLSLSHNCNLFISSSCSSVQFSQLINVNNFVLSCPETRAHCYKISLTRRFWSITYFY